MHTTRRFFLLVGCFWAALTAARAQDYNIKDFGAVSDTLKLSTAAINRAVETCAKKGGGRVVIPAGNYKSGTITLRSNVELYFSAGATLYASTAPRDFPRQLQPAYRSQKDPGGWFALIYAEGASNIALTGYGTIDGLGARQLPRPELLGGDQDGRPRNVLFISCQRVHVENITMRNSGVWNQHYLNCEDVKVTGIQVFNHSNRNNDGIDIDGCRRFVLANSLIDSDDDAIVLKSTGLAGCEDVVVNNCVVSSFTNGLKCGTESTGGFKNISFSNCVVKPSASKTKSVFNTPAHGITAISLEIVDGGVMEGVQVSNITIEGTECPIYVRLGNRARKHRADAPTPPLGRMKDISIANITATHAGNYTSSITGVPGASIENITLSNIRIVNQGGLKAGSFLADAAQVIEDEKGYPQPTVWKNLPASAFFLRHVKQATFQHCSFASEQVDPRQPFLTVDVPKLDLHQVTYNDKPL
jgi:polygalacturonase